MNEKFRQYYNLSNDKNLIDKKTPTEHDKEIFYGVRDLKREQFKKSLTGMTISLLIIIVIGIAMKNIWRIALMLLFGYLEYNILKDFLSSKNWEIEFCDYGNVVDKFIKEDKDDHDKDYYIIVEVNGTNLKYKLKRDEYSELNISDNVIVFAIKEKKETFLAKK